MGRWHLLIHCAFAPLREINRSMKLKRTADDFQVEEQIALRADGGPFAMYKLTKQSLGTLEAVEAIARRWKLLPHRIAFAGLKDKHALTTQYVTIRGGERRGLSQTNLELQYVGQAERPIHASDITANRFTVVLRDLDGNEPERIRAKIAAATSDGVPNYFDNQRFGSLGEAGEFIARPWCLGDYERAVWLALADPNVHDRPEDRDVKRLFREQWGQWEKLLSRLNRWRGANLIAFLARQPRNFRSAIALFPQHLRSLWLAAFQSHLWNQILAALVRQVCRPGQCVQHPIGGRELPFFSDLDAEQRNEFARTSLPLPSARLHLEGSPLQDLYNRVLAAEGLELRQVRVKYPRDSFFSKGERPGVITPGNLSHDLAADEIYTGRKKLTLRFTLPRAAYATILVKQLTGLAADELDAKELDDDGADDAGPLAGGSG
jgi:tRNA pseudouridine13 synthase